MSKELKYIEISKGLRIGVPSDLSQSEINERIEKHKQNMENTKQQHYNPYKKTFVKSKF
jgi:hypothetical protein